MSNLAFQNIKLEMPVVGLISINLKMEVAVAHMLIYEYSLASYPPNYICAALIIRRSGK